MKTTKVYFENLDAIRFVAVLMVFLGHIILPIFSYFNINNPVVLKFINVVCDGGTGVSIFFVLSGFLITYLLISEHEITGTISVKNFYLRRILRIWPLYFTVILFSFFIYPFLQSYPGKIINLCSDFIYYPFFLSNFDLIRTQNLTNCIDSLSLNITWSVSVEEQFYLFWPLLFVTFKKRYWGCVFAFIIVLSLAFRIYNYNNTSILNFHTLSVLMDLAIGGFYAFLSKTNTRIKSFFEKTDNFYFGINLLFIFIFLMVNDIIFPSKIGLSISRIFLSVGFGFFITAQALTQYNSIFNIKKLSFANHWGRYSYAIYLLHPIAYNFISQIPKIFSYANNSLLSNSLIGVVTFILTLALSKLSWVLLESRFINIKKKLSVLDTSG